MKSVLPQVSACLLLFSMATQAQTTRSPDGTRINGNTEVAASVGNATATVAGTNSTARNVVGSVKADTRSDMRVTANVKSVTTVAKGNSRKACTNVGSVVSDECK